MSFRSSYGKLASKGFEATTTEFYSGGLSEWAIRSLSPTHSQSQLCTATAVSSLYLVLTFYFGFFFVSRQVFFKWSLAQEDTFFSTEEFLEVAIEICLSRIWSHDLLILFRRSNQLSYQAIEFNLLSEPTLYSYSSLISLFSIHMSFRSMTLLALIFALTKVSQR